MSYSAAKAAVLNLSQNLAREWATKGVRVNTMAPGFFPAEQNRKLLFNPDVATARTNHLGQDADESFRRIPRTCWALHFPRVGRGQSSSPARTSVWTAVFEPDI